MIGYSSFIVLHKPENILLPPLSEEKEKLEEIMNFFMALSEEKSTESFIFSKQEKFLRENVKNIRLPIIDEDAYHSITPQCIYYIKSDTESEKELKGKGINVKAIVASDDKISIETPEWAENEVIFYGDSYLAEKCSDMYVFSKKEEINILKCMLDLKKPIFIIGERGSGKTTIVQKLIKKSLGIPDEKFVSIACGTLEPNLAKSELFGHVKGAFTGADCDKEGAIKKANGGCLYLDEIQDLSKEIQRILIKGIEEHKFKKVGSNEVYESDFILVCSSNKPLDTVRKILYDDFYDRISFFQYKIKSIEEQKKEDPEFISKCLPNVWNNYQEKCSSKNYFKPYNQLNEYNSSSQKLSVKERIISALNNQYLSGNYRDIEKLLGYIELYALNTRLFSTFPDNEQINKNIDLAISKWEEFIQDRDSSAPELTEAFIEKQTWDGINKMFKNWIAEQAIKIYGSATAAAKALNVDKNSILRVSKKSIIKDL